MKERESNEAEVRPNPRGTLLMLVMLDKNRIAPEGL